MSKYGLEPMTQGEEIASLRAALERHGAHKCATYAAALQAELDRLRVENERLKNDWEKMHNQENWIIKKGDEELDRLRVENERLRRAMDTIRMNCAAPSDWPDQRWVRDTIIATIDANKTEGK